MERRELIKTRDSKIQCRLNGKEKARFEEIRQIIVFENQTGNRLIPQHKYAKEEKVTDADVIRYLINSYKFID